MGVPGSANFLLAGAQGYQIERSLRFNSADSAYLNRTPASVGNRKTWTWSGWVKRSAIDSTTQGLFGVDGSNYVFLLFNNSGTNNELDCGEVVSAQQWRRQTTQIFRDASGWYHIVLAFDSTQATANDRVKVYVNGSQVTSFSTSANPSLNYDSLVNTTTAHSLGRVAMPSGFYFSGYLTEINFIDGQALTPSSFGETNPVTGVWQPKRYAGTYGTNGFYLNFADNSGTTSTTLGKDSSGNGNNWTPNNFSVTAGAGNDSLIDTPTPYADGGNGRGNYCTLNPLDRYGATLSNGNLDWAMSGQFGGMQCCGTWALGSGKWYWEVNMTSTPNTGNSWMRAGLTLAGTINRPVYGIYVWYGQDGTVGTSYGTVAANASSWAASNDVVQIAFDRDSGKVWFGKNGTWSNSGNPAAGTNANITGISTTVDLTPALDNQTQGGFAVSGSVNFGQRPFAYTPPSGFLALNTQNLPEPTIKKPSSYMDVKLYTGNGSTQTISGLDFSPDFVWLKARSTSSYSHQLYDTVRGAGKLIYSNLTIAEVTVTDNLTAFNSNGFALGNDVGTNANAATYAAWCWDESATPGFDIVTYTGNGASPRSINHSLGVAPSFVVVKNRTTAGYDWPCYHTSLGSGNVIWLQLTSASDLITNRAYGGVDSVSSTTFTVKSGSTSGGNVNANGDNYVAYLWSEVAGFSKFGSYTGNGSTDGPFVHCGFRPRWVMIKRTDSTGNWDIFDTSRDAYNAAGLVLYPNQSTAEQNFSPFGDALANGFKIRNGAATDFNASGGTYIFAAFAESPFKYSLAR